MAIAGRGKENKIEKTIFFATFGRVPKCYLIDY